MESNTRDESLTSETPPRWQHLNFLKRIARLLSKKGREIYYYSSRVRWDIRRYLLNRQSGIQVDRLVYLAQSAKLQLDADGYAFDGQIHISSGSRISEGVILAPYGGSIFIDENVYVGPYCVLYGHGGLTVGKNTLIASHTVIIPANHGFSQIDIPIRNHPLTKLGIRIGEDVWIGSGVRVLDGVSIGNGCVIGAGAVVTKSLEDYSVAVGVPARTISKRK